MLSIQTRLTWVWVLLPDHSTLKSILYFSCAVGVTIVISSQELEERGIVIRFVTGSATHFGTSRVINMNAITTYTGGVWRIAAINEAGGWKDRTIVQDMDLAVRACLKGWKFLYLGDLKASSSMLLLWDSFLTSDEKYNIVEQVTIDITNQVGLDVNLAIIHEWLFAPLQFISGLGPTKAASLQTEFGYTVIMQKSRKVTTSVDESVICWSFYVWPTSKVRTFASREADVVETEDVYFGADVLLWKRQRISWRIIVVATVERLTEKASSVGSQQVIISVNFFTKNLCAPIILHC
ncbi:hypothetical protein M8C21_010361 [Ambrosia artemisiifolia]|uniref:Transcription elongation factor Spt6 helix-hairpin-helix motif domain-containing protein n=1 Tax=Ambrosia artemisiifolia TaxID=4212 RepID=A0AAD5C4H8_AMBAR|nr:hypothetical protein M8C21_010361 [Ambrosia artemisiifolia]